MRGVVTMLMLAVSAGLFPAAAAAQETQNSITGVARDASGAVLPGVTVEAASPALIEKTRTTVTDGTGQYRIVNLQSGTYTVTFTLTGFNTYKREGIELAGAFVATINADLKVGDLAETITVTGETPIVDVQSAKRVRTLDNELVQSLPTAKGYASVMLLIPSMITERAAAPQRPAHARDDRVRRPRRPRATRAASRWTGSTPARRSTAAACRAIGRTSRTRRKSP